MVLSASSKRRRDLCIRRRGLSSAGEGAHGGRQSTFLRKARAYGGSCPWRESETCRQKGHRHRESERRRGDFLRETKRRAACPERKLAFNSGEGGSGKKGARRFCRKRAARRKRRVGRECPHAGGGFLREKERAYIGRSGREQSGKPLYAAAATAGEGAQVSKERTKPPFGRRSRKKQNPDRSGFRIGIGWPASPLF